MVFCYQIRQNFISIYLRNLDRKLLENNLSLALETFYDYYPQLEKNIYCEVLKLSDEQLKPNDLLRKMSSELLDSDKFNSITSTLNWFLL